MEQPLLPSHQSWDRLFSSPGFLRQVANHIDDLSGLLDELDKRNMLSPDPQAVAVDVGSADALKAVLERLHKKTAASFALFKKILIECGENRAVRILNPQFAVEHGVTPAQQMVPASSTVYRMQAKLRGLCVILNISRFGSEAEERLGSEVDETSMILLFESLNFEVHPFVDLSAKEIRETLQTFATERVQQSHEAFVCIVMSHGNENGFVGSDHETIRMSEICEMFNGSECAALIGRPKIFFVQACRGPKCDNGVASPWSAANTARPGQAGDSSKFPANIVGGEYCLQRLPSWADIMVVFGAPEGQRALRDPAKGSWLLQTVYEVFARDSWKADLDTMLETVAGRISERSAEDGEKQSIEVRKLGWSKKFYFNPGLWTDQI